MVTVEAFFNSYQHTIAFLAATGTWAAVVTALWLAGESFRPKLRIVVNKVRLISSEAQALAQTSGQSIDMDSCDQAVSVSIANQGSRVIYIQYFSFFWAFPRWILRLTFQAGRSVMQNPVTDFRNEPLKIDPGNSVAIVLATDIEALKSDIFVALCRANQFPLFMRHMIGLYVMTSDGYLVRARKGVGLVEIIKSAVPSSDISNS